MTIKNIKDREIALQARVAELEAQIEASRKQEAVAWKYIHIPSWNIGVSIDHPEKMDKWDDLRLLEIEPLFAAQVVADDVSKERDQLLEQLAASQSAEIELRAQIEASQKQEPAGYFLDNYGRLMHCKNEVFGMTTPLYAAPVVADDVQRDAEIYRWLRDNSASISWSPSRYNAEIVSGFSHSGTGYLGFSFEDAIKEAMKGAA